jgi:hypothetical protein
MISCELALSESLQLVFDCYEVMFFFLENTTQHCPLTRTNIVTSLAYHQQIIVEARVSGNDADRSLASLLYNVWQYYRQFEALHAARLATLRQPLAEKLATHVKTTRWDDRSYARLRQSTKKAHAVLASLARRWQSVLTTPAIALFDVAQLVVKPRAPLLDADAEWSLAPVAAVAKQQQRKSSAARRSGAVARQRHYADDVLASMLLDDALEPHALARLLDGFSATRLLSLLSQHDDEDSRRLTTIGGDALLWQRALSGARRIATWRSSPLLSNRSAKQREAWLDLDTARQRLIAGVNALQASTTAGVQQKRLSLVSFLRQLKAAGLSPHAQKYNCLRFNGFCFCFNNYIFRYRQANADVAAMLQLPALTPILSPLSESDTNGKFIHQCVYFKRNHS